MRRPLLLPWGRGDGVRERTTSRRRRGGRHATPSTPRHHTRLDATHDAIDATRSRANTQARDLPKQGVVFATYASLLGKKGGKTSKPQTRLDQLLEWASPGFEGGLLFDESHKAKNLFGGNGGKPTKTGQAVLKLQTALPRARVVYCSATGASEPKHLGYMDRLGLWGGSDTPFGDFDDFRRAVESRGVGMMELVAMHLKQRGALVSRALSFKSCTFELVNDVMTPSLCGVLVLSRRWRLRGTTSSAVFARRERDRPRRISSSRYPTQAHGARLRPERRGLGLVEAVPRRGLELGVVNDPFKKPDAPVRRGTPNGVLWRYFWGAHQRFFKDLCVASKVPAALQVARQSLKDNKCVVIGLQSTGEARTKDAIEEHGEVFDDFVSAPRLLSNGSSRRSSPRRVMTKPTLDSGSSRLALVVMTLLSVGPMGGSTRTRKGPAKGTYAQSDTDF